MTISDVTTGYKAQERFICEEPKPQSPPLDDWLFFESPSSIDALETPQKIFSKEAEQLHAHIDPFQNFYIKLLPLIHYQCSEYTLLYMNQGKLDYYMPKLPFGKYSTGSEVIDYITEIRSTIDSFYSTQEHSHKWKVLKIARKVLPGLERMINNYPDSSSYSEFVKALRDQMELLQSWITESSEVLSSSIDKYIKSMDNYTLFDLLAKRGDTYPKSKILKLFKYYYGERLANFAIERFLSEDFGGEERISYYQLYGLVFVMAANVKREDLKWKYETEGNNSVPFEKLDKIEIDRLLRHFRCAPNGQNLLDYFEVKISFDKHTLDPFYLDIFPAEDEREQSRLNEISLYADIESTKIWHPGHLILMTNLQMFDQLNEIFSKPYNSQLFHSDRYISFLNVAATCIAYLQSFAGNAEAISANLSVVIEKLEDIADHAHEMYPEGFIERYKTYWLTLIGKLKDARTNPKIDLTKYYLSLFAHPLQSEEQRKETLKLHRSLQSYEFLARKAAYWNWNYQSNSFFLDDKGRMKNPNQLTHRIGTLFSLSNGTEMELFEVNNIIVRDGFCCQICIPYQTLKYAEEGTPIPIKLIFQGTINSPLSTQRDRYFKGAGYELWLQEQTKLVLPELRILMANLREFRKGEKKPTFRLDFIGHSLGGSDAQNAASFLSEWLLTRRILEEWIHEINVHTFNTAGVPIETINRFNYNYKPYKEKIGKITHSIVKNDIVSRSAQCKLGVEYEDKSKVEIMEVCNLGVYNIIMNHCNYIHSWTDNILPHKKMCHKLDKHEIHRYLYGIAHSWADLTIHSDELMKGSPLMRIVVAVATIFGFSLGCSQFRILGESVLFMSSAAFATAMEMIRQAGNNYAQGKVTTSLSTIWEAASSNWGEPQILEGTG